MLLEVAVATCLVLLLWTVQRKCKSQSGIQVVAEETGNGERAELVGCNSRGSMQRRRIPVQVKDHGATAILVA